MFKKTLIAAAVATMASSVAMADVKIGGQVKMTFSDVKDSTTEQWKLGSDNALNFSVTEDLGNGMSAFAKITLDTDATATVNTDGDASDNQKDAVVGLKGAFGTVVMGRMEGLVEGKIMSTMDDGSAGIEAGGNHADREMALAYVSPTVNGVHVAVAGFTSATNDSAFPNSNVAVFYDNGPLSVKIANESMDAANTDVTVVAASYAMGDLKVSALQLDDEAASNDSTAIRIDYKMGNNKIILGNLSSDAANGDVTSYKLNHSFSSRTTGYIGFHDKESGADKTYVGLMTTF